MATKSWFMSLLLCLYVCNAYKILVVIPLPSRSHANLGAGIVRNLLKAGHEVTYITPYEYKNPPKNLRQVDVSSNKDAIPANGISIKSIMSSENVPNDGSILKFAMTAINGKTIENESVQKLLNNPLSNLILSLLSGCCPK